MDLNRRDLFKLGGSTAMALGLSQIKVLKSFAADPSKIQDMIWRSSDKFEDCISSQNRHYKQ